MEPAVTALVELAMTLGVSAVIYVRGRSISPWLLNNSHRSDGDVSVMVSRFFCVLGCWERGEVEKK
eukprot:scaffold43448_cov51-Cyclotella_meneghiniana.AAC.17